MGAKIDLLQIGSPQDRPAWPLGSVWLTSPSTPSINQQIQQWVGCTDSDALLFWDGTLGPPEPSRISDAFNGPGDVWHAGLHLGMKGLPRIIDFISPTWMLNRDPEPFIEATSWRLSLRACLVRTAVLQQMGGLHPGFQSLEAASLELGHRYVTGGVICRYLPWIVPGDESYEPPRIPFEEEVQFALSRFGKVWTQWALVRTLITGYACPRDVYHAWRKVISTTTIQTEPTYSHNNWRSANSPSDASVSVLIPTLDRYGHLRNLLGHLRCQTVKPFEIIIVDQSPLASRETGLEQSFSDLPLRVFYRDHPGQCSARNFGLQVMQGNYVLFLDDDDDKLSPTFIEDHLRTIMFFNADASSGIAREGRLYSLSQAFQNIRISDVFPGGNSLVRCSILGNSGLFDLAYEHGERADGDLGMRVYLNGKLMMLNPEISVFHHRALHGGLRAHGARVITYASSRYFLAHRQLPSATEIYFAMRYFSYRQVREMLWIRAVSTFSIRGPLTRKILKIGISLSCLPHTIWKIKQNIGQAKRMFQSFPQIPKL